MAARTCLKRTLPGLSLILESVLRMRLLNMIPLMILESMVFVDNLALRKTKGKRAKSQCQNNILVTENHYDNLKKPGQVAVMIFSSLTWLHGRRYYFFTKATVTKRKSEAELSVGFRREYGLQER